MDFQTVESTAAAAPAPSGDYMESNAPLAEDAGQIDRTKTRWLVFCGDILHSGFKRTFDKMQMGGEHLGQQFKTLYPTKGILRRCQLTPMVRAYDWSNPDMLGDEGKARAFQMSFAGNPELNYTGGTNFGIECLPGDEIEGIMSSQQGNGDIGIREIKTLYGVEPKEMDYQREIFPNWDKYLSGEIKMPETVASLEKHLLGRRDYVSGAARDIVDTMLESAAQFRRWGTEYLGRKARLVKAPPTDGGQVYSWEQIDLMLFDQLELNREEFLMAKREERQPDNTVSRDEFNQLLGTMRDIMPAIGVLAQSEADRRNARQTDARCDFIKANNEQCKANALDGQTRCGTHKDK